MQLRELDQLLASLLVRVVPVAVHCEGRPVHLRRVSRENTRRGASGKGITTKPIDLVANSQSKQDGQHEHDQLTYVCSSCVSWRQVQPPSASTAKQAGRTQQYKHVQLPTNGKALPEKEKRREQQQKKFIKNKILSRLTCACSSCLSGARFSPSTSTACCGTPTKNETTHPRKATRRTAEHRSTHKINRCIFSQAVSKKILPATHMRLQQLPQLRQVQHVHRLLRHACLALSAWPATVPYSFSSLAVGAFTIFLLMRLTFVFRTPANFGQCSCERDLYSGQWLSQPWNVVGERQKHPPREQGTLQAKLSLKLAFLTRAAASRMRVRIGFVSNSSTSSYVCLLISRSRWSQQSSCHCSLTHTSWVCLPFALPTLHTRHVRSTVWCLVCQCLSYRLPVFWLPLLSHSWCHLLVRHAKASPSSPLYGHRV